MKTSLGNKTAINDINIFLRKHPSLPNLLLGFELS